MRIFLPVEYGVVAVIRCLQFEGLTRQLCESTCKYIQLSVELLVGSNITMTNLNTNEMTIDE